MYGPVATVITGATLSILTGSESPDVVFPADMKKKVSNGFTYNGKAVNVKPFFTPYKMQYTQVGQENIAKFKIFDFRGPENISHFELAFGLDKGQVPNDSNSRIEWDRAQLGQDKVTVIDPDKKLDNVRIETSVENCKPVGKDQCLVLTIYHTFREAPEHEIVATNVWNYQRYAWQNYFNHGITVNGDSLNPPKQFSGIHNGVIFSLTETKDGKAIDKDGEYWTFGYGVWNKDFVVKPVLKDPIQNVMTRNNNNFPEMIEIQNELAKSKMKFICEDCTDSYSEINDIKTIVPKVQKDKLSDPKILKIMDLQNQNATNKLADLYKQWYPGKVFVEDRTWIENHCIMCKYIQFK